MRAILLNGHQLSIEEVAAVALENHPVQISEEALQQVQASRIYIEAQIQAKNIIYGVSTGFGANAAKVIEDYDIARQLQRNLIISHACGVGEALPEKVVRAMMLIRLNTLLAGYSGARIETVKLLEALLNKQIHPYIPAQGSVGASGDLCPLAHMALALIGKGKVAYQGQYVPAEEALQKENLSAIELQHKEGIALLNGTTLMAALAALALKEAEQVLRLGVRASTLAFEALAARKQAFDERVHQVRRHEGQQQIAAWIRQDSQGSNLLGISPADILKAIPQEVYAAAPPHLQAQIQLICQGVPKKFSIELYRYLPWEGEKAPWQTWESMFRFADKKITPQDAYSVRCTPQVLGASLEALRHIRKVVENELNAVVDNPLIFVEDDVVLSAGNFHGQPLALVLDYLKLAVAEMGNLWERQINKLVDEHHNDLLPAFLTADSSGLHSGLMIAQYVAAGLVSENKVLVHPASADSIPTCANQEDHVSMGSIAGRQALEILGNVKKVLAILLLTAAQALEIRVQQLQKINFEAQLGAGSMDLLAQVRSIVPHLSEDRLLQEDIQKLLDRMEGFYE